MTTNYKNTSVFISKLEPKLKIRFFNMHLKIIKREKITT